MATTTTTTAGKTAPKVTTSESRLEVANTQGGKKVAITQQQNNSVAAEFKKEAEIRRDPSFNPQKDKVYSCDPKIGALLPRGTKVNLVVVANAAGTFSFFEDVHAAMETKKVADVYAEVVKPDPVVVAAVNKFAEGIELTADEKIHVTQKLGSAGIPVSSKAGETLDDALAGLVISAKYGA